MTGRTSQDKRVRRAYSTHSGEAYWSTVEDFLAGSRAREIRGRVRLILTSPPFPLNKKKAYGNLNGEEYKAWVSNIMKGVVDLLSPDGSLVLEVGNSWVPKSPEMSTLPLETLLAVKNSASLRLCQQFIVNNPARLPSPVQWVNVERIRVKDTFTHAWWMSPSSRPQADNRRVLTEYSESMRNLLDRQSYNAGRRPSGHVIGEDSFLADNGGAIPSNVLQAANTRSTTSYRKKCHELGVPVHPARMQPEVAAFFIRFLSAEDELVVDPFAGSNTTGAVAESLGRRWLSVEADLDYLRGSTGRFGSPRWWLRRESLSQQAPNR